MQMCAEPNEEEQDNIRRFTLDEIVEYAKENLTIETACHIQLMLHTLMQNDSTMEERKKVSSISAYIRNRDRPAPTHIDHQTFIPKVEHFYDKVDKVENKFPSILPMDDPNKLIE